MGDEPLEPLVISGSVKDVVKFEPKEWEFKPSLGPGPGYLGKIEWEDDDCGYASPESAKGYIKLRKVWVAENGNVLFEGFLQVKVVYGSTLRRKGHGSGNTYPMSFWAVKKLGEEEEEEEGDEVGNEEGKEDEDEWEDE